MMKFEEFVAEIKAAFEAEYPDQEVRISEITKTNGIKHTGITVVGTTTPIIYLEEAYQKYEEGETLKVLTKRLLSAYAKNAGFRFDPNQFTDWEKVKEHGLRMKLVSEESNKELLADAPHRQVCGSYNIIYKYLVDMEDGQGSITIRNSHMNVWGVDEEDLYQLAIEGISDVSITTMEDMMSSILGGNQVDTSLKNGAWRDSCSPYGAPMYVATNASRFDGAAVIVVPGVLKEMADVFKSDLYIIPSSIHEVIVLPVEGNGTGNPEKLVQMIREVNSTEVAPVDVLGEELMFYDRENEELRVYEKKAYYEPEA